MKNFIRQRFKHLGITQADFMQQIGLKRDFYSKRNTMENKLKELNEFFEPLECKVIIVLKKQKSVGENNYEQVYPNVD
jgi:hypothetical protein